MSDERTMWLSTRAVRPDGSGPDVREYRTIDSWFNPCRGGNVACYSAEELWENLAQLPVPISGQEYYLLFTDAQASAPLPDSPRLKLLGHDLSDVTWTSSLFNCWTWQGELEPIAARGGAYGLLNLADAALAQSLLPKAWNNDPHSFVTVWALYEVAPGPHITYRDDATLTAEQLAGLFERSGIRRPTSDLARIGRMIEYANLVITAWHGDRLVGVARGLSDYCYCCYLSDLAVDREYQRVGIGKELVQRVRTAIGPETMLLLLAAPDAMAYYPKIGFDAVGNGWMIPRER